MSIKIKLGRVIYSSLGNLPNFFGGRYFRRISARMICKKIGNHVTIEKHSFFHPNVILGEHSGIGENCYLQWSITIGSNVMMGPECLFYTVNHKIDDIGIPMSQQGTAIEKPIIIGDDVWIGARSIILPGVHIGNGVVIGAGTIVIKNVPDYSVFCGNPGKIVRDRRLNYKKE